MLPKAPWNFLGKLLSCTRAQLADRAVAQILLLLSLNVLWEMYSVSIVSCNVSAASGPRPGGEHIRSRWREGGYKELHEAIGYENHWPGHGLVCRDGHVFDLDCYTEEGLVLVHDV